MSLIDEFKKAGIDNIDDAVDECSGDMASKVNNLGLEHQIEWLKTCGWSDQDIRDFYDMKVEPKDILDAVDEYCQMGLNSSNPKHWEAALADILQLIRGSK